MNEDIFEGIPYLAWYIIYLYIIIISGDIFHIVNSKTFI